MKSSVFFLERWDYREREREEKGNGGSKIGICCITWLFVSSFPTFPILFLAALSQVPFVVWVITIIYESAMRNGTKMRKRRFNQLQKKGKKETTAVVEQWNK